MANIIDSINYMCNRLTAVKIINTIINIWNTLNNSTVANKNNTS